MTIQKAARRGWWLYQFLFFTTILMFVSCGDKGTGPDPEEKMIEVKVVVEDEKTKEALSGLVFEVQDESGQKNTDTLILEREKGSLVGVRALKDGYKPNGKTIEFTHNKTVVIYLSDKVDISYKIQDESESVIEDAEGYIAGTDTTVGGAEGTFTLPYSDDSIELCGRADRHEDNCEKLSLEHDHPDVVITLPAAEMVDVSVSVSDEETNEPVDSPTIKVDDYTYESGEMSHSFPARDGDRSVFVTAAGYDTTETTISADESHDLDIALVDLPECSDDINNDGVDGTDEEDPGCVDENGDYDPQDDNETLRVRTRTLGSTAGEETRFISGSEGEQKYSMGGSYVKPFDQSIKKAVSITVEVEVLVSEDQAGEAFALEWHTGPDHDNLNTVTRTEIAEDQDRNGWVFAKFQDISKDFFKDGTHWIVVAIHATKVRGESPTDGNDDVVFLEAGDETTRSFIIQWEYEPEEVE